MVFGVNEVLTIVAWSLACYVFGTPRQPVTSTWILEQRWLFIVPMWWFLMAVLLVVTGYYTTLITLVPNSWQFIASFVGLFTHIIIVGIRRRLVWEDNRTRTSLWLYLLTIASSVVVWVAITVEHTHPQFYIPIITFAIYCFFDFLATLALLYRFNKRGSMSKYVLFPITNRPVWEMYKTAQACFWTAEEIDLSQDVEQFSSILTHDEQHFIKYVLAFFAASDGIVSENLARRFYYETDLPEARCFYGFQIMIENVHSEVYSLFIQMLIKDSAEQQHLFDAVQTIPCVKKKADWAIRYMESETCTFIDRMIAFAVVEGIFFSGAFCAIFWLKKRNLMPGLTFSNELIARDEGLHRDFACLRFAQLKDKSHDNRVYDIVREAVMIEQEFISAAIPVRLIGMNDVLMSEYVEFVADHLLTSLGLEKIYNTTNPFDWMNLISMQGKTNFFERRVSEYGRASIVNSRDGSKVFNTDADF